MKLRYRFRVYPSAPQKIELAKAFGCARVVWNDALFSDQRGLDSSHV